MCLNCLSKDCLVALVKSMCHMKKWGFVKFKVYECHRNYAADLLLRPCICDPRKQATRPYHGAAIVVLSGVCWVASVRLQVPLDMVNAKPQRRVRGAGAVSQRTPAARPTLNDQANR